MKIKLALLAIAIAFGLSAIADAKPTKPPVRTFIYTPEILGGNEAALKLCFKSKGGIDVRVWDSDCPNRKEFEKEVTGLLGRLGASRTLLKNYTVVFTGHIVVAPSGDRRVWFNGVTHTGRMPDRTPVKLIVLTTNKIRTCSVVDILRHELGHASFMAIGFSSEWLDRRDATPCDYSDDNALKRIVMTPGEKLPPGPIREKFEDTKD